MPKFVIERNIPDAGKLTPKQLAGISNASCSALRDMGPGVQWLESFVTEHKIYCVYIAPNEEAIREHARRGNFPVDSVKEVKTIIDPTNAELFAGMG